jgi:hypothetical protein
LSLAVEREAAVDDLVVDRDAAADDGAVLAAMVVTRVTAAFRPTSGNEKGISIHLLGVGSSLVVR